MQTLCKIDHFVDHTGYAARGKVNAGPLYDFTMTEGSPNISAMAAFWSTRALLLSGQSGPPGPLPGPELVP